jgi:hypothetical protein
MLIAILRMDIPITDIRMSMAATDWDSDSTVAGTEVTDTAVMAAIADATHAVDTVAAGARFAAGAGRAAADAGKALLDYHARPY